MGPDQNMDYAGAQSWATSVPDCGGGWRMPEPAELVALFDRGQTAGTGHVERGRAWPAHIDPAFSAIGGGSWVWSRGSASAGSAPAVNLNQGVTVRLPPDGGGSSVRAFAVRPHQ